MVPPKTVRSRGGDNRIIVHAEELKRAAGETVFPKVPDAVVIDIVEHDPTDTRTEKENIVLKICDLGISPNNVGQRRVIDREERTARKGPLIPERVAVAKASKLVAQDSPNERPGTAAGNVILGEASNPKVNVVDIAVQ